MQYCFEMLKGICEIKFSVCWFGYKRRFASGSLRWDQKFISHSLTLSPPFSITLSPFSLSLSLWVSLWKKKFFLFWCALLHRELWWKDSENQNIRRLDCFNNKTCFFIVLKWSRLSMPNLVDLLASVCAFQICLWLLPCFALRLLLYYRCKLKKSKYLAKGRERKKYILYLSLSNMLFLFCLSLILNPLQ